MDRELKDMNANNGSPEIARQERDIKEGGGTHAENERNERVEYEKEEIEAGDVSTDFGLVNGDGGAKGIAIEDACLDTIDNHTPERQHTNDLIHWLLGNQKFLQGIRETVAGSSEEAEEIAFDLVFGGEVVGVGYVV